MSGRVGMYGTLERSPGRREVSCSLGETLNRFEKELDAVLEKTKKVNRKM